MNDDPVLLRAYVEHHAEEAFTRLVQRHVGLVYSAALRRVGGDTHLAEDVTQAVFADLARKASSLTGHASVAGWLYVSAQRASAAAVRRESRRKARELSAPPMLEPASPSEPVADPEMLRPVIDEAILTLRQDERDAVVLRFFEQRTFAEIGAALRVTEEAARKRVARALDKLQAVLARRGITSTAVALGLALTAVGAGAIPGGLADKVAGLAVAQAGTGATAATALSALWPAAAVLVAGGLLVVSQQRASQAVADETARLSSANLEIPALRIENRQLARTIAEARDLADTPGALPPLRYAHAATAAPGPKATAPSQDVTVTTEGMILWNNEHIRLENYLDNVRALQGAALPGESRLVIRAPGTTFQQMLWVLDEARKAGVRHLVVESDAALEPAAAFVWL